MANNPDIDHAAIERHYAHACEKHPHFCDLLYSRADPVSALTNLNFQRERLMWQRADGKEEAWQILSTEVAEIIDAYARHDYPAAVEECHDAIAVLLRMARMIEDEAKKDGEVKE